MDLNSLVMLTSGTPLLEASILLYLGPETIMPVGSFLAAALGLFLIFWRQVTALFRSSLKRVFSRKPDPSPSPNLEGRGEGSPGND
jgi:hypothetical protein